MSVEVGSGISAVAEFIVSATPPGEARERAAVAIRDTVGVILAGAAEPAARMVQAMAVEEGQGDCRVLGTSGRTSPGFAAMANGAAAHALDYDDMCFVSLAHPSCVLVPTILAAAELAQRPAAMLAEAYVVGFELECRLGNVMNPRHYHERGWHCTSTIGTLGAAAAAARMLRLDVLATWHALGIAASAAGGLKENMGSMVKPLHAAMAARNGLMAARLAQRGFTANAGALEGPQGFLAAMDSQHPTLEPAIADLGVRWEIVDTGITVKLYPSCAATHPPLDVLIDMKRRESVDPEQIDAVDVEADSMTPRLLIHPRPATALEAKFSMPFCAAAALVDGRVAVDTFDVAHIQRPDIQRLIPRITLTANPSFDAAAPLSTTRVTIRLRDGRVLTQAASGARGYPGRLTDEELAIKFHDCATRTMATPAVKRAWSALKMLESYPDVRDLTVLLTSE